MGCKREYRSTSAAKFYFLRLLARSPTDPNDSSTWRFPLIALLTAAMCWLGHDTTITCMVWYGMVDVCDGYLAAEASRSSWLRLIFGGYRSIAIASES